MATISRTLTPNNNAVATNRKTFDESREHESCTSPQDAATQNADTFTDRSGQGSALDSALQSTTDSSTADAFVNDLVTALLEEALGVTSNTTNTNQNDLQNTADANPPEEALSDGGEISWGLDSQIEGSGLTGDVSAAGTQEVDNAHAEPQIDAGDNYTYKPLADANYIQARGSELFPASGPSPDDVVQGTNGDCYLLASAAALANSNPSAIQNMIKDNGNGTYGVTLYYQGKPETVSVDSSVPEDANADPMYAQFTADNSNGKAVLWPLLLEKAFAKFSDQHPDVLDTTQQGFNALNQGGYGAEAMAALTGQPAYTNAPASMSQRELEQALTAGGTGNSVTLGTNQSNSQFTANGLLANHMYTVLGTTMGADGQPYVKLRDPWGFEPNDANATDGSFEIPLSDVAANCQSIVVGQQSLAGVSGDTNNAQASSALTASANRYST
jgi:hypothetical protein